MVKSTHTIEGGTRGGGGIFATKNRGCRIISPNSKKLKGKGKEKSEIK